MSLLPRTPRVLHLFANYKWTGPADPALRCASELRALGEDVLFAQAEWTLPAAEHRMAIELKKARLPTVGGLELRKHFRLLSLRRDEKALARRCAADRLDVLHSHLGADHLIAALAARRARGRGHPVAVVRSLYDAAPPKRTWRTTLAFRHTDAVIAPTAGVAEAVRERFRLAAERVLYLEPPTSLARAGMAGDLRERLGLASDQVAIGITARIQPHRRFELLWEVARRVVAARPQARFVLLGRGNAHDTRTLVHEPIERLRLRDSVVLPGYLYEPDPLALRGLDLFLFLVPGSDGTCRAVREAIALGVPAVTTGRGMLPEILAPAPEWGIDDPCGIVAEETPDGLANAVLLLVDDQRLRERLSAAGRAKATGPMHPVAHAAAVATLYRHCLQGP